PDPGHRSGFGVFADRRNRLWGAGGSTGQAYVWDATTGVPLATYQLTTGANLINDLVVTDTAAYFTNTNGAQVVFKVPLGPNGALPAASPSTVQTLTLNPGFPSGNGIDVLPDGNLIVVSMAQGTLYKVDPNTGSATPIAL